MKPTMSLHDLVLLLVVIAINIKFSFCNRTSYGGRCIQSERQALLRFKQDLKDPSNRLASWIGDDRDCCAWTGVVCDNFTGHVLQLHLGNPLSSYFYTSYTAYGAYDTSRLHGKINPSLLDLKHLKYLDLSGNSFEGNHIPKFLGSMGNLRYLNLSGAGFTGTISHQLGNLSNLQSLDLGYNRLRVENLNWMSGLSLLKYLRLSGVDLSKASDWLPVTNALPSLLAVGMSNCQLHHSPALNLVNFSSLYYLDLSYNQFNNHLIPSWIFELNHLSYLYLAGNNFQGPLPDGLQNLTSLKYLALSQNQLNSSIPNWFYKLNRLQYLSLFNNSVHGAISDAIGNLTSLYYLDLSWTGLEGPIPRTLLGICSMWNLCLSGMKLRQKISEILDLFSSCVLDGLEALDLRYNQLFGHLTSKIGKFKNLYYVRLDFNSIVGPIPLSLGKLSSLRALGLSHNKLNGIVTQFHFENLTKLSYLYISENSLTLGFSPEWVPPFQLEILGLKSCHLGPQFPLWLRSQKFLFYMDISETGISDFFPNWFEKFLSQFVYFNISHNQIYGKIPSFTEALRLQSLDLSSNNLSGSLPMVSFNMYTLDLSDNFLSGTISHFLCHNMNESKGMQILNLEKNFLSGKLPDCWMNWQHLMLLNLGDNKFVGPLPTSIGTLSSLLSLHLHKNSLSDIIPVSLRNCTKLVVFDISENEFLGNIPTWVGVKFSRMVILNLRENKFHGVVPKELCRLAFLQILDLAHNNLSGPMPRCINNFSAMVNMNHSAGNYIPYFIPLTYTSSLPPLTYASFLENELLVMKGETNLYDKILNLVRSIDLSSNNFSGDIPIEMTSLKELQSLNLSYNSFTGRIPESIGDIRSLECFDFSVNQLSGQIPQSISSLTFLNHLNLSFNNLVGEIPLSTQLQSFDASCFIGNELCGSPLPNNCTVLVPDYGSNRNAGNEAEVDWFFVSMVLGFVVGFWCFIGPLLVNRRWRYFYYQFLDHAGNKICNIVQNLF